MQKKERKNDFASFWYAFASVSGWLIRSFAGLIKPSKHSHFCSIFMGAYFMQQNVNLEYQNVIPVIKPVLREQTTEGLSSLNWFTTYWIRSVQLHDIVGFSYKIVYMERIPNFALYHAQLPHASYGHSQKPSYYIFKYRKSHTYLAGWRLQTIYLEINMLTIFFSLYFQNKL